MSIIATSEVSQSRRAICDGCTWLQREIKVCKKCGCFIPAKTKLESSYCPLRKW